MSLSKFFFIRIFKVALQYLFNVFMLFNIVFNLKLNFKLKIDPKMHNLRNLKVIWKTWKKILKKQVATLSITKLLVLKII